MTEKEERERNKNERPQWRVYLEDVGSETESVIKVPYV